MTDVWPPIDAHAHVAPAIDPTQLLALRAVILAATRSLDEYESTLGRSDPLTVWGVGVHPGVSTAFDSYSIERFQLLIESSPLVSEVGLDRRSAIPLDRQRQVLGEICGVLSEQPRIVSIHSVGATSEILDILEAIPIRGAILHWWRGTPAETTRAVTLGCRFSINIRECSRPSVLGQVPLNRILTETDHPYGAGPATPPGDTAAIEESIASHDRTTPTSVREAIWTNLAAIADETSTIGLFNHRLRQMLAVAPRPIDGG